MLGCCKLMKNKILFFLMILFSFEKLYASSFKLTPKNIILDKNKDHQYLKMSCKTDKNHIVESEYAEYNKKTGKIIFKNNVRLEDEKKIKVSAIR